MMDYPANDQRLTLTKKNQVFDIVTLVELSADEFVWDDIARENAACSRFVHSPTGYFFEFTALGDGYYPKRSPGEKLRTEVSGVHHWDGCLRHVHAWLKRVRAECEAPDLWAEVGKEKGLIKATLAESENELFASEEQHGLREAIHELKDFMIKAHGLENERALALEVRLQYLEDAITRMGRKDWTNIALSVIVGIGLELALSSAALRETLRTAWTLFRGVLGDLPLLPP